MQSIDWSPMLRRMGISLIKLQLSKKCKIVAAILSKWSLKNPRKSLALYFIPKTKSMTLRDSAVHVQLRNQQYWAIDKTYNLSAVHISVTSFKNLSLLNRNTLDQLIFLGPLFFMEIPTFFDFFIIYLENLESLD